LGVVRGIMDFRLWRGPFRRDTLRIVEPRPKLDSQELIEEIARRLANAAPGAKVILFGSRSRGEERPNSDVDLMVIQPGEVDRPVAESARLRRELRGLGVNLDLLVVGAKYAEERGRMEGSLMKEVLSEGRVLVNA
jgi:predicted nucleotidyltransferase